VIRADLEASLRRVEPLADVEERVRLRSQPVVDVGAQNGVRGGGVDDPNGVMPTAAAPGCGRNDDW
jgi:hypothetical protein